MRPSGHPEADFVVSDRHLRSLYSAAYQVLGGIVSTSPSGPVDELCAGRGLARRLGYLRMQSDVGEPSRLGIPGGDWGATTPLLSQ